MIIQTEAIVLKTFDFRETSRIATFFTKDYGRMSGVLKGIRKDPRKFGSSLDRFSVNDIVYYQYRNSDLHLVSQCDLREFFFPVRRDLKKSLAASYFLELVYALMPSEEKNIKVYQLLLSCLSALGGESDIDQTVHMFQIKMLLFSGFRPHLDNCMLCGRQVKSKALFSLKEGGLVCGDCLPSSLGPEQYGISPGTVASILHIERSDWANCQRLKLTPTVKKELKYLLNNFLVFHLGRKLRSAKYLTAGNRSPRGEQPKAAIEALAG